MSLIKFRFRRRRRTTRKSKKTINRRIGKTFVSAGIGRYGPYALVRRNISRRTGVKASIGTRGLEAGVDGRISKKTRVGAGYNVTTGKPYAELKYKKKKMRI